MGEAYREYLRSPDWLEKRREKHGRKGGRKRRCAICASPDRLDVHHLRYEADLTTTAQEDLRLLCRRCHDVAHELLRAGILRFPNRSNNSRFTLTKTAVKKALGLTGQNLFYPK